MTEDVNCKQFEARIKQINNSSFFSIKFHADTLFWGQLRNKQMLWVFAPFFKLLVDEMPCENAFRPLTFATNINCLNSHSFIFKEICNVSILNQRSVTMINRLHGAPFATSCSPSENLAEQCDLSIRGSGTVIIPSPATVNENHSLKWDSKLKTNFLHAACW